MLRTARSLLLFVILGSALSGCAHLIVTVDALSAGADGQTAATEATEAPCIILPGQADVRPGDLLFLEYKERLAALLQGLGYTLTDDKTRAAFAVLLSWDSRDRDRFVDSYGPSVGVGMGSGGYHGRGGGGFFGLGIGLPVGNAQVSPLWRHTVTLDAFTLGPKGDITDKSLWKVTLNLDSSKNNLRALMPAMLQAARLFIGKDSHGPVTVSVEE